MLIFLRKLVALDNPIRLLYHFVVETACALWYGLPPKGVVILGVTGTKGKTTTSHMLAEICSQAGYTVGMATTAHFRIGEKWWINESKFTTLKRGGVYRFIRDAVGAGCTHIVLEVSSHALMQSCVRWIRFDGGVLTNLSPEHLDFHGTMERYREAKGRLFMQVKGGGVVAVPVGDAFADVRLRKVVTHGEGGMVYAADMRSEAGGQRGELIMQGQRRPLWLTLFGGFNAENFGAAAAVAIGMGVPTEAVVRAAAVMPQVPGRLQEVMAGQEFRVVVDYAHTEESIRKVLDIFRPITPKRLWAVYGACGDRDRSLRAGRGRVLSEGADRVIITTDDPYTEDPKQTIADVMGGVSEGKGGVSVIEDREEALRAALLGAEPGDTVLLLGKGSETVQVFADGKRPWSDVTVAERILRERASEKR